MGLGLIEGFIEVDFAVVIFNPFKKKILIWIWTVTMNGPDVKT
jgi:hypothetical protein